MYYKYVILTYMTTWAEGDIWGGWISQNLWRCPGFFLYENKINIIIDNMKIYERKKKQLSTFSDNLFP